jgi:hypothetical protein
VTLVKGGNSIYLQFKTPNKPRSKYRCNCTFTLDGIIDAVRKASKVKEKLESLTSEVEFWGWYDKEIKQESQLKDDRLTFGEAIVDRQQGIELTEAEEAIVVFWLDNFDEAKKAIANDN